MVLVLLPLLRELGIAVLRCIMEHRDQLLDRDRPQLPCRGCATVLTRTRNVRQTNCYTLFGKLIFNRRNYLCSKCKRSEYPLDWSLKLLDRCAGHSDEFASMVVLLTTLLPNAKAMCLFHKCFGFEVSTQLARTLSFEIGHELHCQQADRAEHYWKLRTEDPEKLEPVPAVLRQMQRKKRMYFMLDDSKLGIQEGARGRGAKRRIAEFSPAEKALRKALQQEKRKAVQAAKKTKPGPDEPAKVPKAVAQTDDGGYRNVRALLIFEATDLAGVSKGRCQILRKRIVAHIGTLEEWRKFVYMALVESGTLTAHEVFVIADGGTGIWEMVEELLPSTGFRKVIHVLDFYHASSHLWAAGRAYKGNDTAERRRQCIKWVTPLLADLKEGRVANVIQRLGALKVKGAAAEEIAKVKKYFETHRKRMRYAWLRDQQALIGSGAMESVHAWVIQARCRLPGMRWSAVGANAMLRLRCAWASDT